MSSRWDNSEMGAQRFNFGYRVSAGSEVNDLH